MWLKACPRCGGDLYKREEPEGLEITCIQCSRIYSTRQLMRELVPGAMPAAVQERAEEEREVTAVA